MRISIKVIAIIISAFTMFMAGCSKEKEVFSEPYGEGKNPLGIKLNATQLPVPESGLPGSSISINVTGLLPYKLIFRINGEQAVVTEITETGLKATVPDMGSSGVTSISVGDQVVFGPIFKVTGFLVPDPTFRAVNGTNGYISQYYITDDSKVFLVGNFNNYDNKGVIKPINRIVRTFKDGTYDASLRSGRGANGSLSRILPFQSKLLITGNFNGYDQRTENISNITQLNTNGSIDTMGIKTFRRPTQTDTTKYFPRFNGGVAGGIYQLYEQNNKILVVGQFRYYVRRQYDKPNKLETKDTVILDSTEVKQIAKLNPDGSLDKTYRFNTAANMSLPGGNGNIGSILHKEGALAGKMLIFGNFTKFDDKNAGNITRLNEDGSIDPTFNPGGVGADFSIYNATYNLTTKKYMIVGNFRNYNGKPIAYIAMLNEDGTLDQTFVPKQFTGSQIGFAKQLNTGLIVVSGYFKTYDAITRNGFMVLEPNGSLAVGYNATGLFNGDLSDVVETTSEDGRPALLLIGEFNRFDNEPVNNIIRLIINK
jgi:hypothetical protein